MKKKLVVILVVVTVLTLGIFLTARAIVPSGIPYNPADEGYCEAYGITIDTTQVDAIYLHPETILANPVAFLSSDTASLLLAQRHAEANDPLDIEHWVKQIDEIAGLPMDEREKQKILAKLVPIKERESILNKYQSEVRDKITLYKISKTDNLSKLFGALSGDIISIVRQPGLYSNSVLLSGRSKVYREVM